MISFPKIVLIGMPGSGKSTVGRELSRGLDIPFFDLDNEIVKGEKKSIAEIFDTHGESYFRELEQKYLYRLLNFEYSFILSSGGGTPCHLDSLEQMLKFSKVFYLEVSISTLVDRLNDKQVNKRPLLSEKSLSERLEELFSKRYSYYERAHYKIREDQEPVEFIRKALEKESKA